MNQTAAVATAGAANLKLLMFQTFACTMAMMAFTTLAGPIGGSLDLAPWQMGLAVTAGGIAWMMTAHAWGKASDRRGRRPVLLLGLGGFALCYAGLCLSASLALRGWLPPLVALAAFVAWRGLAGAFYAAVPVVGTALVADHTPKERRPGAIAALGIASGMSMVFGPALAALFASHSLETPLYAMAALPALAFVTLWYLLPKSGSHQSAPGKAPPLSDPRLRHPVIAAFICMQSVAAAQIVVGFFAIDRLGLTPQEAAGVAGIALTCVGVALTATQAAVRHLHQPPERLIRCGAAAASIGFISVAFSGSAVELYAGYFLAAAGMGLAWPSISALAANAVEPHEQGAAAGAVSAAQGLGTIVGPTLGAASYGLVPSAPYFLVAGLLAGLALWGGPRPKK